VLWVFGRLRWCSVAKNGLDQMARVTSNRTFSSAVQGLARAGLTPRFASNDSPFPIVELHLLPRHRHRHNATSQTITPSWLRRQDRSKCNIRESIYVSDMPTRPTQVQWLPDTAPWAPLLKASAMHPKGAASLTRVVRLWTNKTLPVAGATQLHLRTRCSCAI
jgi:hypothetical protein